MGVGRGRGEKGRVRVGRGADIPKDRLSDSEAIRDRTGWPCVGKGPRDGSDTEQLRCFPGLPRSPSPPPLAFFISKFSLSLARSHFRSLSLSLATSLSLPLPLSLSFPLPFSHSFFHLPSSLSPLPPSPSPSPFLPSFRPLPPSPKRPLAPQRTSARAKTLNGGEGDESDVTGEAVKQVRRKIIKG